jgi:hypothetical protein
VLSHNALGDPPDHQAGPLSGLIPALQILRPLAALRNFPLPRSLPGNADGLLLRSLPEANCAVGKDVEKLKQRLSLLDYLRQQSWTARPIALGPEFVGLFPLHPETRPSFYVKVNPRRRTDAQYENYEDLSEVARE